MQDSELRQMERNVARVISFVFWVWIMLGALAGFAIGVAVS